MFVDASDVYGPGAVMAVDATEAEVQMANQQRNHETFLFVSKITAKVVQVAMIFVAKHFLHLVFVVLEF